MSTLIDDKEVKAGQRSDKAISIALIIGKVVFWMAVAAFVVFYGWSLTVQYLECKDAGKVLVQGAFGYECVSP